MANLLDPTCYIMSFLCYLYTLSSQISPSDRRRESLGMRENLTTATKADCSLKTPTNELVQALRACGVGALVPIPASSQAPPAQP